MHNQQVAGCELLCIVRRKYMQSSPGMWVTAVMQHRILHNTIQPFYVCTRHRCAAKSLSIARCHTYAALASSQTVPGTGRSLFLTYTGRFMWYSLNVMLL